MTMPSGPFGTYIVAGYRAIQGGYEIRLRNTPAQGPEEWLIYALSAEIPNGANPNTTRTFLEQRLRETHSHDALMNAINTGAQVTLLGGGLNTTFRVIGYTAVPLGWQVTLRNLNPGPGIETDWFVTLSLDAITEGSSANVTRTAIETRLRETFAHAALTNAISSGMTLTNP